MQFTQQALGSMVSRIFFGVESSPLVIPIQGNFRDPQDGQEEGVPGVWLTRSMMFNGGKLKPDTWIGYLKRDSNPRTISEVHQNVDGSAFARTYKISKCRLQFVGRQAEEWAESVSLWLSRDDVLNLLVERDAMILADGLGACEVSNYYQGGLNNVLAYNVSFNVEWASTIDAANTGMWTSAQYTGTVVTE